MYIKFCRSYVVDKKEKPDETTLSVELEGEKVKQVEGNAGLYRLLCLILTIICLILLILVFVLGVKLQTESTVCPGNDRSEVQQSPPPTCNLQDCHKQFKRKC
ncbi:hypothetical protein ILYODFUR_032081 [Ilyodon furcidens]|uniref:Uncharacterized protein n=1 Tax=Ilyodon furcidens TaxID=33524 RepID=A0ABV0VIW5_9TELE